LPCGASPSILILDRTVAVTFVSLTLLYSYLEDLTMRLYGFLWVVAAALLMGPVALADQPRPFASDAPLLKAVRVTVSGMGKTKAEADANAGRAAQAQGKVLRIVNRQYDQAPDGTWTATLTVDVDK
jgi:hypothetical protein